MNEIPRSYPKLSSWQAETLTVDYGRQINGFSAPAQLGDKIWLISARPRPGHDSEYDSVSPYHFDYKEHAIAEMDWLNADYPGDNYLLACITIGWISPDVLRRTDWRPPWAPIGLREEDQPYSPFPGHAAQF
ncbi:hypothetical protein [Corynebacterium lizhenjunii]|uniref:hypothetical protein n=1 Tax=Corynebacterium lizhenjunii TaxID=2709394 RepID=UPI0013E9CF15|nr:hypothetical protein [Corynebacterium lizhenjunii]